MKKNGYVLGHLSNYYNFLINNYLTHFTLVISEFKFIIQCQKKYLNIL